MTGLALLYVPSRAPAGSSNPVAESPHGSSTSARSADSNGEPTASTARAAATQ